MNCLIILGPTAVGKTALAVRLAEHFAGEILSADSRQVYRGLDIGSGKDLGEYRVPYHLIDIADLSQEYSVFDYQQDFYRVFATLLKRNVFPVIAGGTGMYLDAIVRSYDLVRTPENKALRQKLESESMEVLSTRLENLKKMRGENLHNDTDLSERKRLIRAIEIEIYSQSSKGIRQRDLMPPRSQIDPLIIGTSFPRCILRSNIKRRLIERLRGGMIEEVENLHRFAPGFPDGVPWQRFERLGLEYRYIAQYLQGQIPSLAELEQSLFIAIGQFAKRQETWFRGMERKGVKIHWLPHRGTRIDCEIALRFNLALELIQGL